MTCEKARRLPELFLGSMGLEWDHKNRNKHDNRRLNLRPATRLQNQANRAARSDSGTGIKGVRRYPIKGGWQARIKVNGKERSLGVFDTAKEAAARYNRAAQFYFGEFAFLNDIDSITI